MKFRPINAEPPKCVSIQFTGCEVGWIRFTVTVGAQSVEIHASHVFDPFPDLLTWMNAILTGVDQCAFAIDEEGCYKKFRVVRRWDDTLWFSITNARRKPNREVFIRAPVKQRQLIEAIYTGVHVFARSSRYVPEEWEYEGLGDRVYRLSPDWDQPRLTRSLAALNHTSLHRTLIGLDPDYADQTDDGPDTALRRAMDRLLHPDRPDPSQTVWVERTGWDVPEDYDEWPMERKLVYIQECLREPTGSWDGCNLRGWQSATIEKYLNEEEADRSRM